MPNSQTLVIQTLGVFAAAFVAGCNSTSGPRAAVPCCDTNISAAVVHEEATPASPYVSPWLPPSARSPIPPGAFEDQSGRVIRLEHLGAPVALSFVYTRCQNQRKCPAVARAFGELQAMLGESGLQPRPYVALVTYDPDYDISSVFARFAEQHGINLDSRTLLLRPARSNPAELFSSMDVAVNYRDGLVNIHRLQLILLDKEGRPVRTYHSLMWDNAAVLNDLARLAAE